MLKYIAKRVGYSILILLGVSMIIYFLIRLMPVDFIQDKINAINQGGATVSEETVNAMYAMYGLGDDSFQGILNLQSRHTRCINLLSKELVEGTKLQRN